MEKETPHPIYDVKDFGARGDGIALDTVSIQSAIDACAETGGVVRLSDGTFLCGTLRLKSRMTLWIDSSAVLMGSPHFADYPTLNPKTDNAQLMNCQRALIYAESAEEVILDGGGVIEGQNSSYERFSEKECMRPMAVFSVLCRNVQYKNLTIQNACTWSVVSMEVTDLYVAGLRINTVNITRDGLDFVDCHRVLVENCQINTGDDGICLKSHSALGLKDIVIRNCQIQSYTNALKFGTPTYGPIENILFQDIEIRNTRFAGIAVEAIDGSQVKNITFERITMDGVGALLFVLLGNRGSTPSGNPRRMGSLDGLVLKDIQAVGVGGKWGSLISGTTLDGVTYRLKNIELIRVHMIVTSAAEAKALSPPEYKGQYPEVDMWGPLPSFGYWVRHVEGFSLKDCSVTQRSRDPRPWLALDGVQGFVHQTATPSVVTTIRVKKELAPGQSLSLRGDPSPLNWEKGSLFTWNPGHLWIWQTTEIPLGQIFDLKILIDDAIWEAGGNRHCSGGLILDIGAEIWF